MDKQKRIRIIYKRKRILSGKLKEKTMEQIILEIKDKHKAKKLSAFLSSLDFVNIVRTVEQEDEKNQNTITDNTEDFFDYAGMWADREISLRDIRQKAWPGNYV
jgi:hypothetical protein